MRKSRRNLFSPKICIMQRTTDRELAPDISKKSGVPEKEVLKVLQATDDVVLDALLRGERVQIAGLGSFHLKVKGWTNKVIPGRGRIRVPARWHLDFTASSKAVERFAELSGQLPPDPDAPTTDPTGIEPQGDDPGKVPPVTTNNTAGFPVVDPETITQKDLEGRVRVDEQTGKSTILASDPGKALTLENALPENARGEENVTKTGLPNKHNAGWGGGNKKADGKVPEKAGKTNEPKAAVKGGKTTQSDEPGKKGPEDKDSAPVKDADTGAEKDHES